MLINNFINFNLFGVNHHIDDDDTSLQQNSITCIKI